MGKRILVADDSLTIQKAFAMVLSGQDYTLVPARSLDEALSAAKGGRPDLVIADAVLGNSSGYDLCASLKADPALRGVPVHILASTQNPLDETRAQRAGADGHFVKPFDSQTLIDGVSAALAAPARVAPGPVVAAAPTRPAPASSWPPAEANNVTEEGGAPEDDSYGEFTIERGSSSGAAPWAARPPTWPGARQPTPPPPTATSASRPSLIPGVSAPTPVPGIRPGPALPGVVPPGPVGTTPRSVPSRTIMGFPAMGSTPSQASPNPTAPPLAARPAVPRPSATQPPVVPRTATPTPPPPSAPTPPAGVVPQAPVRRSGSMPIAMPSPAPAPLVAAVSSAIDQKVAVIAARGREYEAIAKLSREIIEQVVWEVVPELAEVIIKQEIDRLVAAKR
jgi:CheY-like chemotaxis protein